MAKYHPECRINISAVFDGLGSADNPITLTDIIPFSVNVHLNSYKEADTWEVTFDAKAFPFSPELLRSAAVEIYLYQKEDGVEAFHWSTPEHLVSTGLVDNASMSHDESGGIVTLSGRDYTALLIDRQWDPTKSGNRGRIPDGPLDGVIQDLVDEAVQAERIGRTLTVQTFDYDFDITTKNVSKTVTHKKVTIKPPRTTKSRSTRKKRGITVKADSTYWDVIYKLALSYGYIVFVRNFDVVLSKPHVLQYLSQDYFRVAYGRNLSKLEMERKLSKEAVPQIRVRSYDPKTKQAIEGRFPSDNQKGEASVDKKGNQRGFVTTGVGTKKEEYKVYTVPDVTDPKTLVDIARTTYYTLARGEGSIKFQTPHLKDLGKADTGLDKRDMLLMRSGDAVEIVWDAFNTEIMMNKDIPREQKVSTLLQLGYSQEVSALVAANYSKLDFLRQPFYVKEVNLTWDSERGALVDVEALNFINPERDGVL